MSEMLGNQYFLGRKYLEAAKELEEVLTDQPHNKTAMKKLVICYSQLGNVQKTLTIFHDLISEDIGIIINTDIVEDDCPCPELVNKSDDPENESNKSFDYYAMHGVLWLYCNVQKSLNYFEKASEMDSSNKLLKSILSLINSYIDKNGIPKPFLPN